MRKVRASTLAFSPAGDETFDKKLLEYQQELETECDRIELGERTGTTQEITPQHIERSAHNLRYEPRKKKPGAWYFPARIGSPLAGALLGFSVKFYNTPFGATGIVVGLLIIGASEFYKYQQETR